MRSIFYPEANKKSFVDATLSVKVLDPAMGSGHFLVGSIEFLAGKMLVAAQKDIEAGRLSEDAHLTPDWARREVVAHCIYGVDLNDLAVELAKVSLWLTTISKEKPLSFLDHRLKQGNSLIGACLSDIKYYPGAKKKDKDQTTLPSFISPLFITHLIGKIAELEKIKDERLEDIKKKEKIFEEFKQLPEYHKAKALANIYTGIYFGNEVKPTENKDSANVYYDLFWAIMGDENEWRRKTNRDWFLKANQIASDKSFFHWELEFPDLFFEGGAPKGLRTGSNEKYIIDSIEKSDGTKIVAGSDIERYVFNWKPKYLITKNGLPSSYFKDNELKKDKIVIQYVRTNSTKPDARWLECTYIEPDYVGLNSLSFIYSTNIDSYSIKYLLTLLNSKLMNKYYRLTYTDVNVKPAYLSNLPIRRISFTTPPDRRAALVEQAKALYSEFLGAPTSKDLDRINRMDRINSTTNPVNPVHPVQTAASLSAASGSEKRGAKYMALL